MDTENNSSSILSQDDRANAPVGCSNSIDSAFTCQFPQGETDKWVDDRKQTELENSYKEVCALIAATSNKDFLLDFFNCLFTESERKNIAERWLLVKGIDSGLTQREIAKKYNMSLCKITRGSKELKRKDSAFLKMLEISKKI